MNEIKAVVLDGHTLNPGDLDWQPVAGQVDVFKVHPRTLPDKVLERAAGARILFTNKTLLGADLLRQLPEARYIGVLATGYNVVDLAAARERGIVVTNAPAYGTETVAQMVFALLFALTRRVEHHSGRVKAGVWAKSDDFCFWETPQVDLNGATLGIVGFGAIGRAVARMASAIGMRLLVHSRSRPEDLPEGARFVGLEELLASSDVISLHCPLTDQNRHMIGTRALSLMQPHAYLINTSRGPLVDEAALAGALAGGQIAGAALDVMEREPPAADSALYGLPHCIITPHIAWATRRARARLMEIAAENLAAWLRGRAVNVVNS